MKNTQSLFCDHLSSKPRLFWGLSAHTTQHGFLSLREEVTPVSSGPCSTLAFARGTARRLSHVLTTALGRFPDTLGLAPPSGRTDCSSQLGQL